jgi:hypothetical protein
VPPFPTTQLSARKLDLQRLHDRVGDLILQLEHIAPLAIVGFRPQG